MVQKNTKERVNSHGKKNSLHRYWDEMGWVAVTAVLTPNHLAVLSMNQQVLVSRISWPSWSFLQCTGSNFQEPTIPKYSHCALSPSFPDHVSSFCVGHLGSYAAQETWKVENTWGRGKDVFTTSHLVCLTNSPDPWNVVQEPSVCLFVLWRSTKEPAERAGWHRPAYRHRRDDKLPQLWKNIQISEKKYPIQETETTQGLIGKAKSRL